MVIKGVSKLKILWAENYIGFVLFGPFALFVGVVSQIWWMPFLMLIPFVLMNVFVYFFGSSTRQVKIGEKGLIVYKRQDFSFTGESVQINRVKCQRFPGYKGLRIKTGLKEAFLWQHEFEEADWKRLMVKLKPMWKGKELEFYKSRNFPPDYHP